MSVVWRRPAVLAAGLCVFVSAGCSGLLNSFRTGPDGLTNFDTDVRTLLQQEKFDEAVEKVGPENSGAIGDRLLQLMDESLVRHYAGDYVGSNAAIERAVRVIDDRYTKGVSKAVFSLAINDRILAYDPDLTEKCFLHYDGALIYLALGDPMEAAVEARRLAYLLDREEADQLGSRELALRRALRYFTAIVFEAAGEENDAAVAYRNVWGPDAGFDLSSSEVGAPEPGETREVGDLIVLSENGFVAHRWSEASRFPCFERTSVR